jgi:hypothetical protein
MEEYKKTFEEIFGRLHARLHKIDSGSFEQNESVHPAHQIDEIENDIFRLPHHQGLQQINRTLEFLNKTEGNLPTIIGKLHIIDESLVDSEKPFQKKPADEIRMEISRKKLEELAYYKDKLLTIKSQLESLIESDGDNTVGVEDKIQTALSVTQIGSLFRLLIEANVLNEKNKQLLIEKISKNFTSKKAENISQKSLYNSMYDSVDKSAFKFWQKKLSEMLGEIPKILK